MPGLPQPSDSAPAPLIIRRVPRDEAPAGCDVIHFDLRVPAVLDADAIARAVAPFPVASYRYLSADVVRVGVHIDQMQPAGEAGPATWTTVVLHPVRTLGQAMEIERAIETLTGVVGVRSRSLHSGRLLLGVVHFPDTALASRLAATWGACASLELLHGSVVQMRLHEHPTATGAWHV
jgi:hypothetical protein